MHCRCPTITCSLQRSLQFVKGQHLYVQAFSLAVMKWFLRLMSPNETQSMAVDSRSTNAFHVTAYAHRRKRNVRKQRIQPQTI